jgi:hypothetical protein
MAAILATGEAGHGELMRPSIRNQMSDISFDVYTGST